MVGEIRAAAHTEQGREGTNALSAQESDGAPERWGGIFLSRVAVTSKLAIEMLMALQIRTNLQYSEFITLRPHLNLSQCIS